MGAHLEPGCRSGVQLSVALGCGYLCVVCRSGVVQARPPCCFHPSTLSWRSTDPDLLPNPPAVQVP